MTNSKSNLHLVFRFTILTILLLAYTNIALAVDEPKTATKTDNSVLATAHRELSTPELIERDFDNSIITNEQRLLYLAYAVGDYESLPAEYQSNIPWDGTLVVLILQKEAKFISTPNTRKAIEAITSGECGAYSTSLPNTRDTTHFHIEYDTIGGGMTIDDYATALEGAWDKEITQFGWANPPVLTSNPPPGNRYHIRIDALPGGLFGVTYNNGLHAGLVGDNPNTSWNDIDAYASCISIKNDFSGFNPIVPQRLLDSTSAHELHHSIQYGYGVITGTNVPDISFIESSAAWIEDEVYDTANVSNHYGRIWPIFTTSMGQYTNNRYSYWHVFRGLTERYGTGTAGGSEQVMQDFWEETSKSTNSNMLAALNTALSNKGTNLADAYHAYAIAAKFVKSCGGSYIYPYCYEEANDYLAIVNQPAVQGTINNAGESYSGSVQDNYAINWVSLPKTGGTYNVMLQNTSGGLLGGGGGQLRGSVVCDTGTTLNIKPLPSVVTPGESSTLRDFDPSGCSSVVLVVTNQSQTADNPSSSSARSYKVRLISIAFVIDDTGSMAGEINQVKTTVNQKVDEFVIKGIYPKFHLLTYKDDVNYRGATTDPITIKDWVNGLYASGGGDCPEEMLGALNRIAQEAPHSEAWVMTDAGFHGGAGDLANTIYNLVKAGVTVHPIVYSWCFDPLPSYGKISNQDTATRENWGNSTTDIGTDSFAQIANQTGGHYFQINSSDTQAVTSILLNEMITSSDFITNTDRVTTGTSKVYSVQIDGMTGEANFLLNGLSGSVDLILSRPDGTQVNPSDPGVTFTGISNAQYFQIVLPLPGIWQAQVIGDGSYTFSASGNTPISLDYLSDTSLPWNKAANLQALLTGPVSSATFKITHVDGSSPTPIPMFDDGLHGDGVANDSIYGGVWTPTEGGEFYFHASGVAEGGSAFEQVATKVIRVQSMNVMAPIDLTVVPNTSLSYDFIIANNGSQVDTYDLTYSSSQGWADFTSVPTSISIDGGHTFQIQIPVNIPVGAAIGTHEETTLVAVSRTNAMINDADSVITTVKAVLPKSISVKSNATTDGWLLESAETSTVGGTKNSTTKTFIIGDNAQDKQYRSIISFNTANLPDTSVITKVTLKIRQSGLPVGTNPFTTHGGLKVDIRRPYFGTSIKLSIRDFQAAASKSAVGTFGSTPANSWYSAILSSTAYPFINLTGTTQFRLRFVKDDNDDMSADYMRFISGDHATVNARPTLIIEYYIP